MVTQSAKFCPKKEEFHFLLKMVVISGLSSKHLGGFLIGTAIVLLLVNSLPGMQIVYGGYWKKHSSTEYGLMERAINRTGMTTRQNTQSRRHRKILIDGNFFYHSDVIVIISTHDHKTFYHRQAAWTIIYIKMAFRAGNMVQQNTYMSVCMRTHTSQLLPLSKMIRITNEHRIKNPGEGGCGGPCL